jgi:hypothetical protein
MIWILLRFSIHDESTPNLYYNHMEVVLAFHIFVKFINSGFSFLTFTHQSILSSPVWQKLEEENREFFKAYYVRLMLKNQIMAFNKLLEDQYRIMTKEHSPAVPSVPPPVPNGSNSSTCKFLFFLSYRADLTSIICAKYI